MRLIHRPLIGILLALLAATGSPQCSHAADTTKAELLACAKLGDDLERLSCYDRLTQQAQSDPIRRKAPVSAAAPDMFGLRPQSEPATDAQPDVARTALKFISARVTSLHESQRKGALVGLDNGQTWQQLGTEDLLLKVGDSVKISRGAFDSFILMTEGNRVTHVKRLE